MEMLEEKLKPDIRNALTMEFSSVDYPHWAEAKRKLAADPNNETLKNIVATICIATHFCEHDFLGSLLRFDDVPITEPQTLTPTLRVNRNNFLEENGQLWIWADNSAVVTVPNIYEGLLTIYSMHYVFEVAYDRRLSPVLKYLDFCLGMPSF